MLKQMSEKFAIMLMVIKIKAFCFNLVIVNFNVIYNSS